MSRIETKTYSGRTLTGDMTITAGHDDFQRRVSIRIAANPCDAELHFSDQVAQQLGEMLIRAAESTRAEKLDWEKG